MWWCQRSTRIAFHSVHSPVGRCVLICWGVVLKQWNEKDQTMEQVLSRCSYETRWPIKRLIVIWYACTKYCCLKIHVYTTKDVRLQITDLCGPKAKQELRSSRTVCVCVCVSVNSGGFGCPGRDVFSVYHADLSADVVVSVPGWRYIPAKGAPQVCHSYGHQIKCRVAV